jgi:hypothetical protein
MTSVAGRIEERTDPVDGAAEIRLALQLDGKTWTPICAWLPSEERQIAIMCANRVAERLVISTSGMQAVNTFNRELARFRDSSAAGDRQLRIDAQRQSQR